MKKLLPALFLAAALAVPALADPAFSTAETDIGTLLDNPETRAVLLKLIPDTVADPQFDLARAMTLRQVQPYAPEKFPDELLARIDTELAKVPAAK